MELIFSYNFNKKLDCLSFSTIRLKKDKKFILNEFFNIAYFENGKKILKEKHKLVYKHDIYIHEITEAMARIDTGYDKETCKNMIRKMYSSKNVDWLKQKLTFMVLTRKY